MTAPIIAPYGTWRSPITAARVAAGVRPLAAPRVDGDRVCWLEGLPEEGGRVVVVERGADGARRVLTPAPFNVRTRVHEYGGGAWCVDRGTMWFSNFADNLVYEQAGEAAPRPLTTDSAQRHADFELDPARRRLIAVREDHSGGPGKEPVSSIVALPLDGGASTTLVEGNDFHAAPRLSPEGRRLAWITWSHPRMPWEGTELWIAAIADDGTLVHARRAAGGPGESIAEPRWAPDGRLYAVSDAGGWWNLHRLDATGLVPILPMAAEFTTPQWVFAQASFGFAGPHEIVAACRADARSRLLRVDLETGAATPIETGLDDITELRIGPGFVVLHAGGPATPACIVKLVPDAAGGVAEDVLARSADTLPDPGVLSAPRAIDFPSANGRVAHAFHYPPRNDAYVAPAGERPPLLVMIHGGPTSATTTSLRLAVQFWTSRGFAVLDVNYGGSTGFGRAYRELLSGQWGVVDVEDCVAGARHLAQAGHVDGARMAIRGGSAGGFTTLSALAFHDTFKAGASYYGVADLRGLDDDTHKFESRYMHDLLGPPAQREALYAARSPLAHADRIACPVIFFQGLDDKVVLPAQSEMMVAALRARGVAVEYHAFEGEGHGFRRKETLQTSMEAELAFYAKVFGFAAAG